MSLSVKTEKEEIEYLDKVKSLASHLIEKIDARVEKEKSDIFELKKYIWTECGSMDELEYGNLLNDTDYQVKRTNDQIRQIYNYKKILDSAYFGRIDFKTDDDLIKVYIGINSLYDDGYNYIFDWRAPISSMFYDYTIGKAKYEAPLGTITGEIKLRRQYKIEKGKLKRIIESDININDEVLQEVLSSNSSEKMKNIVTTIQKEQNIVIRNTEDKYLIVQGIAGSGKTSVALHRIAYLLYKEKNLNYNNILIFSPNDIFTEYISDVLPELGEENVLNTTFNELVGSYLKQKKNVETFSDFLERSYNNDEYSIPFSKENLDVFIKDIYKKSVFKKNITINGFTFNTFELNDLFTNKYKKLPILERLSAISEYICNSLAVSISRNKDKIKTKLLKELDMELDPIKLYKNFLEKQNINRNLSKKIYYEDLVNIIYIYFELNGYPYNTKVKHIVIDEAQDYSKLQFFILKKIFPYAYFTILGDINQAINPYSEYKSLNEINDIFDGKANYIELNKTYRSSAEIIDYANKILNISSIYSMRGKNGFPVITRNDKNIKSIISDIEIMKKNKLKTIAIITKDKKETNTLYNSLTSENTDISFIKNNIDKSSIAILPSYMAKGLEFDGVIAYNSPKNKYTHDENNLFYVVCTRAQHQLIVYNN